MNAVKEKLEASERGRFRKLELAVAQGISSFVVVGEALREIRNSKLYREEYKTFEKYVDQRWGMARQRAYQLIDAADVKANLSTIVDKNERAEEINKEGQLRELKDVPAESMEAVVDRAGEIAGDDPITASDLKQARVEILEQPEPELVYEDCQDDDYEWEEVADDAPQDECKLDEFKLFWKDCSEVSRAAIRVWVNDQ